MATPLSYFVLPLSKIWLEILEVPEILGLFFGTLTADEKYSLCNRENLLQTIQMELSKKQNIFSGTFAEFLKSTSIFELFEEKHDPRSLHSSEITDCKRRG